MTDEILKQELIYYFGYSKDEAEQLVIMYNCNYEIDDLIVVMQAKKESCSRL